jgi:acyl-CoA thioesterase I
VLIPEVKRLYPSALVLLWFVLVFLILTQTAKSEEPRRPLKSSTVLVLGDSLAAGFGVDPSEAFPAVLQQRAEASGMTVRVINGGVSGDTTAGGLRRLDWMLKSPVDVLFLELGGNDGLRGLPIESTRSNLTAIIQKTRSRHPKAEIVVAGMQMPPNVGQDYADRFRALFPAVAREEKAALVPFLLEGVGGVPDLNLPDQIHPTAQGHRMIASNAWPVLEPLLRRITTGS